jgi:hypothetical protein
MNKLSNIIKGKNDEAQLQLDNLFKRIGSTPRILWYPNSGNDFRDLLELSVNRAGINKISDVPDLYIHSDYRSFDEEYLYYDERTEVEIENKFELELKTDIDYYCGNDYEVHIPQQPTVYLLNIKITSDKFGIIKQSVIYFIFESFNFLDQIILRNKLKIFYLVKVRDGYSKDGPNNKSISNIYAFLSKLATKYILVDSEIDIDNQVINKFKNKYKLQLFDYNLKSLHKIPDWSGLETYIYSTSFTQNNLDIQAFNEKMNSIIARPYRFRGIGY